jgi:RNA polymerase sigma factor (sigma-70 family)
MLLASRDTNIQGIRRILGKRLLFHIGFLHKRQIQKKVKRFILLGNLGEKVVIYIGKRVLSNQPLPLNEELLIEECRKGRPSAQKALYERYAPRMMRICFRYLRDEFEAEEALIKGFTKVFAKIGTFEFRGEGSLEGWMKRIMINECLMFLRKANNFNLVPSTEAQFIEADAPIDSHLAAEDIYALLLELPTGYRTVFNLYAIEGFSHKEVADQLGISENTSKSQLSKARNALKALLIKKGICHENGRY